MLVKIAQLYHNDGHQFNQHKTSLTFKAFPLK